MPYKPGSQRNHERQLQYDREQRLRYNREYDKNRPEQHKIYSTSRWQKLREYKKHRNPLCEECLRNNEITPMALVDHIIPIAEGGAPYDVANLQSLCASCHQKKHAEGRGGRKV